MTADDDSYAPRAFDVWSAAEGSQAPLFARLPDSSRVRARSGRFPLTLPAGSVVHGPAGQERAITDPRDDWSALWARDDGRAMAFARLQRVAGAGADHTDLWVADGAVHGLLDGVAGALVWRQVFDWQWRATAVTVDTIHGAVFEQPPPRLDLRCDPRGVWADEQDRQLPPDARGAAAACIDAEPFAHMPLIAHLVRRAWPPETLDVLAIDPVHGPAHPARRTYRHSGGGRWEWAQDGWFAGGGWVDLDDRGHVRAVSGWSGVDSHGC